MWETKELQSVTSIYTGIGFPKKLQGKSSGEYPFYKVGDISKNVQAGNYRLPLCENYLDEEDLKKVRGKLIPEETVVFAKIGEALKLNRRGIINCPSLIDNNAIGIKADTEYVADKYLFYFFQDVRLEDYSRATTVPSVRKSDIEKISIPVPPLPTQHRIVEKIEELFSELDNGVENLKKAQKQLKTYRQAVLKDAFEGKLTKEWREQQTDLPTPEELLLQIKAERKAHRQRELAEWEKEVEQWEKDGEPGRKPRKPRKVKEVDPISESEQNELSKLPENWQWIKLGQIIDQPKYGTSEKCDYDFEGYGVLRIPNIGKGIIEADDMKYAPLDDEEASKYALEEGDLLTIRSNGSIDLVGKCALIRETDTKFLHAGYLIRLRPYKEIADSKFLLNVLSSVSLRSQIESKAKSTSGVNNINSGELQDLIIPFCGIEEQKEIVNEIESRLSVVDQLEQTIKENLQKAEALRQSILKKAFGGELVQ